MYNKGLFANWVPKPLQLLLIAIFSAFTMSLSGVNTGNITYMYSSMGSMSEYFSMANYATTIGMGAVMPLVMRFKFRFKVRDKLTFAFFYCCFKFVERYNQSAGAYRIYSISRRIYENVCHDRILSAINDDSESGW